MARDESPSPARPDPGHPAFRRTMTVAALCVIAVASAVIATGLWYTRERTAWVLTDAETIRAREEAARARDVLWQPGALLPGVSSEGEDYEARISEDGQSMFFVRGKAGGGADIYVSARRREGWTEPLALDAVNSPADDLGPEPSADGTSLFFYSDRPGGAGGYDLWVARKGTEGWEQPVNLGPGVNTPFNDYGPALTPDGATLYFASNRPLPGSPVPDLDAWSATLREQHNQRDYDLYSAPVTEGVAGEAARLEEICTPANEGAPALSPFGDFLYFASDRSGGLGGFDLYRSRRLNGEVLEPENLGDAINSPSNELDPGLFMGGFALHFSSDRPLPGAAAGTKPDYNLYRSYSREVFREGEPERRQIDWALLAAWLSWLLPLILLPVLLLALLRFSQSEKYRKLSLLARCVLVSSLVHALVLLAMTFWQVGNSMEGWFRPAGGSRIAINRPAGGDAIASQLRGDMTYVSFEPAALEAARHDPATQEEAARASEAEFSAGPSRPAMQLASVPVTSADSPTPEVAAPTVRPGDAPAAEAPEVQAPSPGERLAASERSLRVAADGSLSSPEATRPEQAHAPAVGREAAIEPTAVETPAAAADGTVARAAAARDAAGPAASAPRAVHQARLEPAAGLAVETPAVGERARADEAAPATPMASAAPGGARPDANEPVSAVTALNAAPDAAAVTPSTTLAPKAADATSGSQPVAAPAPMAVSTAAATTAAGIPDVDVSTPASSAAPAVGEAAAAVTPGATEPARGAVRLEGPGVSSQFAVAPGRAPVRPAAATLGAAEPNEAAPASNRLEPARPALGLAGATEQVTVEPPRAGEAVAVGEAAPTLAPARPSATRGASRDEPGPESGTFNVAPGRAAARMPAGLVDAPQTADARPAAARLDPARTALALEPSTDAAVPVQTPGEEGGSASGPEATATVAAGVAPASRPASPPESSGPASAVALGPQRSVAPQRGSLTADDAPADATPLDDEPEVRLAVGLAETTPIRPTFDAPADTRPAGARGTATEAPALDPAVALAPARADVRIDGGGSSAPAAVFAPALTSLESPGPAPGREAAPPGDALALALPPLVAGTPALPPSGSLLAVRTPDDSESLGESSLSGTVVDAITNQPLAGAIIRLDVPDGDPVVARTGPDGSYELRAGALPTHVAVSASRRGYTPESINIPAADLRLGARRDFRLFPRRRNVVALEADPVVHHLGDNGWEGQINSQFQRSSEGLVLDSVFPLAEDQLPPRMVRAEVVMLAKGTQAQNRIRINGHTVERALTGAPRDGSYGEFRVAFPIEWLLPGENTLTVESVYGSADYDDFEFVNVQIRLTPARTGTGTATRPG